jgi:hypothetical protein
MSRAHYSTLLYSFPTLVRYHVEMHFQGEDPVLAYRHVAGESRHVKVSPELSAGDSGGKSGRFWKYLSTNKSRDALSL